MGREGELEKWGVRARAENCLLDHDRVWAETWRWLWEAAELEPSMWRERPTERLGPLSEGLVPGLKAWCRN